MITILSVKKGNEFFQQVWQETHGTDQGGTIERVMNMFEPITDHFQRMRFSAIYRESRNYLDKRDTCVLIK